MLPPNYERVLENLTWLEKLGDSFTGLDKRLDYLNRLLSTVIVPAIVTPEEYEKYFQFVPYKTLTLDISEARDNVEYPYEGNFLYVINPGDITGDIYISLSDATNPKLNLLDYRRIRGSFKKFFITNEVGTGNLELVLGKQYTFELFPREELVSAMNLNSIADVDVPSPTDGQVLYWNATNERWEAHTLGATITFIIDGAGSAIATGQVGHLEIPFACTIQQVTMLADQTGSIVVDIWKDTLANFPPTDADSITASAPPTISAAQKSQDTGLNGWTTSIAVGDVLAFNVDSCSTITRVTISLKVVRT